MTIGWPRGRRTARSMGPLVAVLTLALAACSSAPTGDPAGSPTTGTSGPAGGTTSLTTESPTSASTTPATPATSAGSPTSTTGGPGSTSGTGASTSPPRTAGPNVVDVAGIGVLQVGATTAAAETAGMIRWDDTACQSSPGVAGWVAAGRFVVDKRPSFGFDDDGPRSDSPRTATVTRIDISTGALRTAEGIGIGSSEAALRAAYGSRLVAGPIGDFTRLWLLRGNGTVLVFEVMRAPRAGDPPVGRLVLMRIVRDRPDAIRTAFASGDVAGGCRL